MGQGSALLIRWGSSALKPQLLIFLRGTLLPFPWNLINPGVKPGITDYGSSFSLFAQKCDAVSQLHLPEPSPWSTSTGVIYKQLLPWHGSCPVACGGPLFHNVGSLRAGLVETRPQILADFNLLCDLGKPLSLSEL